MINGDGSKFGQVLLFLLTPANYTRQTNLSYFFHLFFFWQDTGHNTGNDAESLMVL